MIAYTTRRKRKKKDNMNSKVNIISCYDEWTTEYHRESYRLRQRMKDVKLDQDNSVKPRQMVGAR
jgi:hypothetical protein